MAEPLLAPAPVAAGDGRLLFVLSGNMVLDAIEVSVVLVALPSIATDLGLSIWAVQWLMSAFALGFAAVLLLYAALGTTAILVLRGMSRRWREGGAEPETAGPYSPQEEAAP